MPRSKTQANLFKNNVYLMLNLSSATNINRDNTISSAIINSLHHYFTPCVQILNYIDCYKALPAKWYYQALKVDFMNHHNGSRLKLEKQINFKFSFKT